MAAPRTVTHLVSSQHLTSKLRQCITTPIEGESHAEKIYRERSAEVDKWHHEFWVKHNVDYMREKNDYTVWYRTRYQLDQSDRVPPEEMAKFNKMFLDRKLESHKQYNRTWWKYNLELSFLGAKAFIYAFLGGR
eukprot:m.16122 g.16122  ORF g.16122 m.16122 type:complete len:134 (-) comp5585_c1_seq1:680-1081(-)